MTTIWLDIESGTYYSAPPLRILTKGWSAEDWYAWEETMSDSDRQAWGEYHLSQGGLTSSDNQVSPSKWCDPKYKVPGWEHA
jgi:hypothetical protein